MGICKVIAFFGPDGSGKSTHAELLAQYLRSNGTKVKKVWIRSPHTFAYLISLFLVKIGSYRIVFNPFGKKKKLPAVHNNCVLRLFWSIVELISVIPIILFRVYIPMMLGYTVIAEGCPVDTIVNIAYHTQDVSFAESRTAKILLRFIPRKALLIYLDSNYKTLVKRRGKNVEARSLIKFQRDRYKVLKKLLNATYINTSRKGIRETSNMIFNLVDKKCKIS